MLKFENKLKMNQIKTPYIAIVLLFVLAFTACKKERSPRLIVQVVSRGIPVAGAIVRAYPGEDPQIQSGSDPSSVVDTIGYDKTTITDAAGEAIFEFENSAVLDVMATFPTQTTITDTARDAMGNPILDAMGNPTFESVLVPDTLRGLKVVKIELVRQREESNDFKEVIDIN